MVFNTIFRYMLFLVIWFGPHIPGSKAIWMAFLRTGLLVETSHANCQVCTLLSSIGSPSSWEENRSPEKKTSAFPDTPHPALPSHGRLSRHGAGARLPARAAAEEYKHCAADAIVSVSVSPKDNEYLQNLAQTDRVIAFRSVQELLRL